MASPFFQHSDWGTLKENCDILFEPFSSKDICCDPFHDSLSFDMIEHSRDLQEPSEVIEAVESNKKCYIGSLYMTSITLVATMAALRHWNSKRGTTSDENQAGFGMIECCAVAGLWSSIDTSYHITVQPLLAP
ncbi:uncharacterized protein HKW66_Vig0051490 [Vigna angularis]|uniref:Uncharacterized protein n=1 Tax=Phaseolus angularis TaxID=3914 RepID=A0A8T0L6E7_PHAAN|nr:uncharacterized protein HKW66_Vig0051480 [Vigna angularis]KAG2405894.1 uncharacterized protein HKW66_Vig0051490 [Vigna angularis]